MPLLVSDCTNSPQRPLPDYLTQKQIHSGYDLPIKATLEGPYPSLLAWQG